MEYSLAERGKTLIPALESVYKWAEDQMNEAVCPKQIEDRSIVIDGDSGSVIKQLLTIG